MAGKMKLLSIAVVLAINSPASAKNLGQHGPVWPIEEQDLLEVIYDHLAEKEAAGDVDALQQQMTDSTKAYVNRPTPVGGLRRATETKEFLFDPSIIVQEDIADHEGTVFAQKGQMVNPLQYSGFNKRIIILDGDDPEQVAFALQTGDELDTLLVITNGAPLELMREHNRRFWFDQDGIMVKRFEVVALPTVIKRADPYLSITEVNLDD